MSREETKRKILEAFVATGTDNVLRFIAMWNPQIELVDRVEELGKDTNRIVRVDGYFDEETRYHLDVVLKKRFSTLPEVQQYLDRHNLPADQVRADGKTYVFRESDVTVHFTPFEDFT